jgi:inorganic pyrophosphatase/exopolyphosphatase
MYLLTTVNRPAIQNPQEHEVFYEKRETVLNFLNESGNEFIRSKDKDAQKIQEKFIDMLGIIRLMAKTKSEQTIIDDVDRIARKLFGVRQEDVNFASFSSFIQDSRERLRNGVSLKKRIVFVMGHKNPDTDTAVSSLIEAYRNSLLDTDTYYIPVIQGSRIPDEIRRLLGEEISDSIVLTDCQEYAAALHSGLARWILVDQNVSEVQRYVVSIVDHHILSRKAQKQDISITWEMVGSATALVTQKFHGMGVDVDKNIARILYGATLMDTEDRSDKKMTFKDTLVMNDLRRISNIQSDKALFQTFMSHLLNTDDAELLFNRDYKQDWGIFGFAVAKTKGAFAENGQEKKKALLDRLVECAKKNNKDKNFPLTIVKVADYLDDNETVNRERVYLIFNDYVLPEFKYTMFQFISKIIENEFRAKNVQVQQTVNSIDFWGVGDQLSRKVTAPFFEPIVEAFNEYYYSALTNLYVKREFLKVDEQVQRMAQKFGIELSVDHEGRVNNITYNEAKQLVDSLGLDMMSLSEYWKILKEAGETHDEQMLKHLRSAGFVELLDTVILEGKYIINHPKVVITDNGYEYIGERNDVNIPVGVPGLIYPEDIDLASGFPKIVQNPRQYGDKRLWRYWSPDGPLCIPTRGHIFLLNQPSFDTKIHPDDALPNLGIRVCCKTVKPPMVKIIENEKGVNVEIFRA